MFTTSRTGSLAIGAALLAAGAAAPGTAVAATASSTMNVTATVTANCTVSTTALAFGNVDTISGADVDSTGGLSIRCTNGTGWSAAAGVGAGAGANYGSRRMTSGANQLTYNLYTTAARNFVWGDGSGGTNLLGGTGTGNAQAVTVYGRVGAGQTSVPAGAYADTVTVTVTY